MKVREEVNISDEDRDKLRYEIHHYDEQLSHTREQRGQRCCSVDNMIRRLYRIDFDQIQAVSSLLNHLILLNSCMILSVLVFSLQ